MQHEPTGAPAAPPPPAGPRVEVLAGLTTFLTMSYIVVVNPQILSGSGLGFQPVLTATVLTAFLGTLLMGVWARLPYAVAPGMGINAFFTFELVKARGLDPRAALGLVVWSGVVFVLILIPLSFSITSGILCGFVLHPPLFALAGRAREVRPVMWGLFALALGLLTLDHSALFTGPAPAPG